MWCGNICSQKELIMNVGKRAILREASKWYDEVQKLKKECTGLFQMLFGIAVKLYIVSPNDEIFQKDTFKPEFLEKIKEAAKKTQEPPAEASVSVPSAQYSEAAPQVSP